MSTINQNVVAIPGVSHNRQLLFLIFAIMSLSCVLLRAGAVNVNITPAVHLNWQTMTNYAYQIHAASNVVGPYIAFSPLITGTGGLLEAFFVATNGAQFFTVQETNPPQPASYSIIWSTGPFGLPANAASVDWIVLNNSTVTQTFAATVFRVGRGAKTMVPPGSLIMSIAPGEATHNANSVGVGQPFEPGFDYEVIVEAAHANVLPRAVVWSDLGNTQIAGTGIPPKHWVQLSTDPVALPTPLKLSTGPFGLPANAVSVDWAVLNNSTSIQAVTVTVFRISVGAKIVAPPGAITFSIAPGESFHNANSVGSDKPFEPGFEYEVVVETAHPNVLPRAAVWSDFGNTQIPGTIISSGSWLRLQ